MHVAFGALATDHAAVAVMLNEYNVLVQYPRFAFLRDAVEATERLWVDVLDDGMRAGDFRDDVARRRRVPLPARRDLGERPLVPAGRTAPTRRHRRRVPHRAPRWIGDETTDHTIDEEDPMSDDR